MCRKGQYASGQNYAPHCVGRLFYPKCYQLPAFSFQEQEADKVEARKNATAENIGCGKKENFDSTEGTVEED